MSLFETEAIILNGLRLGEADKLVTLLTARKGKVKAVAKGARRLRSRFGAVLEPFTYCNVILFEKKPTVLMRISQADILRPFMKIREDLDRIHAASRMAQIVSAILPEGEANPKIFSLLLAGLGGVEKSDRLEWLVRIFEIRCLKHAGYQARLDRCLICHREIDSKPVYFSPKNGGTLCGPCARTISDPLQPVSPGTVSLLRLVGRMNWSGLFRLKATPKMLQEVKSVNDAHLAFILGKPI
ncbi:MAG TPA: DNA repair protein RecO [Nitrospiria bacterium]|nr:DNA repair protein RecO [Nitrospiria bacterium]HUK56825.1 DNA repair protein RecO [Nitrospiria bacterium]